MERVAERLNLVLGMPLQSRLEADALKEGLAAESAGVLARTLLERFWTSALDPSRPFAGPPGRSSAGFCALLHREWGAALGRASLRGFASALDPLARCFSDLLYLDGARLDDIALRLGAKSEEGSLVLPGRVAALYDLRRGFARHFWFEPDADRPDPASLPCALERAGGGSLVIADGRYATEEMFDLLDRRGVRGAFRISLRSDLTVCLTRPDCRLNGFRIEDAEVVRSLSPISGEAPRRLRRLTAVHGPGASAFLCDVLDPEVMPSRCAIALASIRWGVERLFAEPKFDLAALARLEPEEIHARLITAVLIGAAVRTAKGWLAARRGQAPESPDSGPFLEQLARAALAQVRDAGVREGTALPRALTGETSPIFVDRVGLPARKVERRRPEPAPREEMMSIAKIDLDPDFIPFCHGYSCVGHRDGFLWKWVQRGIELTTLPSVDPAWAGSNRTAKLLGVMLDVLLDDVADNLKDGEFLDLLLEIPFPASARTGAALPASLKPAYRAYYQFTAEVWAEIRRLSVSFPRYRELAAVFEFDYRQLLNTMRYACLVNSLPVILNPTEHDLYQPHNMHMMISGTLDLMCSPEFDLRELALLRQALWRGQVMGRIGNMVSTWEREIKERDFTSGVFAAVIDRGLVAAEELPRMSPERLSQVIESSGVIAHFLDDWVRLRDEVYAIAERVRSVDLSLYAGGLEELIRNHLGSRGLK